MGVTEGPWKAGRHLELMKLEEGLGQSAQVAWGGLGMGATDIEGGDGLP
jgi:hypothetical protein